MAPPTPAVTSAPSAISTQRTISLLHAVAASPHVVAARSRKGIPSTPLFRLNPAQGVFLQFCKSSLQGAVSTPLCASCTPLSGARCKPPSMFSRRHQTETSLEPGGGFRAESKWLERISQPRGPLSLTPNGIILNRARCRRLGFFPRTTANFFPAAHRRSRGRRFASKKTFTFAPLRSVLDSAHNLQHIVLEQNAPFNSVCRVNEHWFRVH